MCDQSQRCSDVKLTNGIVQFLFCVYLWHSQCNSVETVLASSTIGVYLVGIFNGMVTFISIELAMVAHVWKVNKRTALCMSGWPSGRHRMLCPCLSEVCLSVVCLSVVRLALILIPDF